MAGVAGIDEARVVAEGLARQRGSTLAETTPTAISDPLFVFCRDELYGEPTFVPVAEDPNGVHGFCNLSVAAKVKQDGGRPLHGWTIWELPGALWTAEFHVVWKSPDGKLVDVTPKPDGETSILFVPDETYPDDFDFAARPLNRRRRIRPDLDRAAVAASMISSLAESQRAYEAKRASKVGLSLEEWMERKVPNDRMSDQIDTVIRAIGYLEEYRDDLTKGANYFTPDRKFIALNNEAFKAMEKLKAMLAQGGGNRG